MGKNRFILRVYNERCKDCGICFAFCPKDNLQAGADGCPVFIDQETCSGCKMCEYMCPDFAIQVQRDDLTEGGKPGGEENA